MQKDPSGTNRELVEEISALKQRIKELEQAESERKRVEEALRESEQAARRLAQENKLIAEIGQIISSTLDIGEIYGRFAEKVKEAIAFDRISVSTVNMKDNTRTLRYDQGDRLTSMQVGQTMPIIKTGIEQVLRIKSSLLINNKGREDLQIKFPGISKARHSFETSILVPLISKGEVIGVLAIHSYKKNVYSEQDLNLAERVGNQIAGAIANAELFQERKQIEEALRNSHANYRALAETSDSMYLLDRDCRFVFANDSHLNIIGLTKEGIFGKRHAEINLGDGSTGDIAKGVLDSGEPFHDEMIGRRSKRHWLRTFSPLKDDLGNVTGVIVISKDITERKLVEEALKESEEKYYDLYENAPDMYYSMDLATGAIRECNETFVRTTGYSKKELIGHTVSELYDEHSAGDAKQLLRQFQETGEISNVERRIRCKDGRIIDVSLNVSAVRDKGGKITYTRSIWHDITKRKEQEEMIRALSITDQLTGLYNRRGFNTLAEQLLKIAERTRKGIFILFADVDNLKDINDKLGHKSGDEAIVEAATVLKEVFRKMDIIGRMGGDEFAVMAAEASSEYADMIKKRLQDQLDIHNSRAGRDYILSLSIGMVYHPPLPPNSLDELISCADSLMYEEKRRKMSWDVQKRSNT